MDTSEYYFGTEQECIDYNNLVTQSENYQGVTQQWDTPHFEDPYWYVLKHPDYPSAMGKIIKQPS